MAPFAEKSAMVWDLLKQESNVRLGPIRLDGVATQRRVTVDGTGGAALSVMSHGELHALGLALFLPRATAPESPFRFVVIDDPVQSMDPAKVDGLARLLALVHQLSCSPSEACILRIAASLGDHHIPVHLARVLGSLDHASITRVATAITRVNG